MREEKASPEKEISLCKKTQAARFRRMNLRRSEVDSPVKKIREDLMSDYGFVSLIGKRKEMEDEVAIKPSFVGSEYDFFGVYDGHGGSAVARVCGERMHVVLAEELMGIEEGKEEEIRLREGMMACFKKVDGEVSGAAEDGEEAAERTMGSTAVVAVVGRRRIFVANCGDSRAVLCRGGVAVPLSVDHKVFS